MTNVTYTMIKPDISGNEEAVKDIKEILKQNGFDIVKEKKLLLDEKVAKEFYSEHMGKDFFEPLIEYMTSGYVIAIILNKDNAVKDLRKLIGSTNPEKAEEGTIRKKWAKSMRYNAIHGSDSDESANREIEIIFN